MAAGVEGASGPGLHEVIVLANLLVVFGIVYVGARKGILGALSSRSENIRQRLFESKRELSKVTDALNTAKAELRDFENTKNRIVAEVRAEAEQVSRTVLEEASVAADRILQDAKLSAKDEARGAFSDLRKELVAAALTETQTLLSQSKDQQASLHKQLFEQLSNDVKGAQINGR
jgi:F-type H+-transporting ATPase subunit b